MENPCNDSDYLFKEKSISKIASHACMCVNHQLLSWLQASMQTIYGTGTAFPRAGKDKPERKADKAQQTWGCPRQMFCEMRT
jgi:hypothetical protein